MDDEVSSQDELKGAVDQFVRILSETAPHRPDNAYPQVIKVKGRVVSPMPRNLQLNGSVIIGTTTGYTVKNGYDPAPYALYANAKAKRREGEHGPQYLERSIKKFRTFLEVDGWEED